jgi:Family of unknown function (DUF6941)
MAKATAAILSDVAYVRDGLVYILAGGINRLYATDAPAKGNFVLTVMVELESSELEVAHEMSISVVQVETTAVVATAVAAFQAPERRVGLQSGEPVLLPLTAPMHEVVLPDFGPYDVRINLDDEPQQYLTLWCVQLDAPDVTQS